MGSLRGWVVVPALVIVFACGSDDDPPGGTVTTDGGVTSDGSSTEDGGTIPTSVECTNAVKEADACTDENGCCTVMIPDSFGPEGFRCKGKKWTSDTTCLPPPPACLNPLTGSLSRADGTTVNVTCIEAGGQNGVASVTLTLSGGELMEVYFDRAPQTGDVLDIIPFSQGPRPDAGAANRVAFRIGRPGGFAGFDVRGTSESGKLTVTAVTSTSPTAVQSVRASIDATVTGNASWAGKLTGSW